MSEIEKVLKNVVLGGIGAAAVMVEKSTELAKNLVEKGEETLRQNQEVTEDIKEKVKNACDSMKYSFNLACMTVAERAELRRQLDAFEEADAACAQPEEAADAAEEVVEAETDAQPAEDAPITEDAYTAGDENADL